MRFTSFFVLGAASLALAAPVAEPAPEAAPVDYGKYGCTYLLTSIVVDVDSCELC